MTDTTAEPQTNSKTALTDAFRTHFSGDAPITEKAANFAKARPWTSAAFAGLAGMVVLNALRGRS
jgi:N-acetylglucosamine kinase-like BadF-type ATPase